MASRPQQQWSQRFPGIGAEVEPEDSVSGMRERIDELTIGQTGRFVRFNGEMTL